MCPGGRSIIALPSTAKKGKISRITATLTEGAGVVTSRGDVRYVVTEFGIADLLGKSIRERAMALISIAHPDFRDELLESAKSRHYVFQRSHVPRGRYPREIERIVETRQGEKCFLRAMRLSDEQKFQDFLYRSSGQESHQRFRGILEDLSHERLQEFIDIDYEEKLSLVLEHTESSLEAEMIGIAQYVKDSATGFAEVALIIADDWRHKGLGPRLFSHLVEFAQAHGIRGFTIAVPVDDHATIHLLQSTGLTVESNIVDGAFHLKVAFRDERP